MPTSCVWATPSVYRDDSYEIVKSLRGKVRQCVVSNGTVVAQTKKLTRSGLGALMDGVFLSEQLGAENRKGVFRPGLRRHRTGREE